MKTCMLIAAACLSLVSITAVAEVYKWTDAQGNIHYGDRQPENQDSVQLNVHAGRSATPSNVASIAQSAEPASAAASQTSTTPRRTTDGLSEDESRSNCILARQSLDTIKTNSRIRITENGEQRFLTPEEISAKQQKMQALIASKCSEKLS